MAAEIPPERITNIVVMAIVITLITIVYSGAVCPASRLRLERLNEQIFENGVIRVPPHPPRRIFFMTGICGVSNMFSYVGSTATTLSIAFVIPPESAVNATKHAIVITARTTPYSAIVCPSSRLQLSRINSNRSVNVIPLTPPSHRTTGGGLHLSRTRDGS